MGAVYWIILLLSLCLVPLCFCESHYSVLGVSKHAKSKEIKKAYYKLAHEWHPDKNKDQSAPDMMAKINHAYEVLSHPDQRRRYDLLGDSSYSSGGYSHSSSRGYSSYSSKTSHKPPSTVEPSDKINTETFMNNVLPDSITVPYLIYFYHDYNIRCEYWTKLLKDMKNDFQTIGIKKTSVDVIINTKVSTYCGIYIHEVPKIVLLLNKKYYLFKDMLSLDNLKEFIYAKLPSREAKHINDLNNVLSVKTRIINNKPSVLLVSPRTNPTLNYKIVSFTYRMSMDFRFVFSSVESESNGLIEYLNLTEGDHRLYIYSDLDEPVTILEDDDLNREMTMNALEKHKFLTLPRVNSCNMLDTLCPSGPNTRWCVLLVSDIGDIMTDEFRNIANKWSSRQFNMGYLNKNQQSTLMDVVSTTLPTVQETDSLCDNEELSRPILLLHRLTIHKLEYRWYNGYCGTGNDNTRLLEMIQTKQLNEATTMEECMFGIEHRIEHKPVFRVILEFFRTIIGALFSWLFKEFVQQCDCQKNALIILFQSFVIILQFLIIVFLLLRRKNKAINNNNSDSSISDSGDRLRNEDTINGDSHLYSEENYNDNDDDGNSSSERVVRLETDEETADIVSGPQTVNTVTNKMTVDSRETSFEKRSITERQFISERTLIAERPLIVERQLEQLITKSQLKMERQLSSTEMQYTVDSSNNVIMTSEINSIQDNSDLFDT